MRQRDRRAGPAGEASAQARDRVRQPTHPGLTRVHYHAWQRRIRWRLYWLLIGVGLAWAGLLGVGHGTP